MGLSVDLRASECNPSNGPLVLIGASGFGREILWVCRRAGLAVIGFCDDAAERQSGAFCGLPLLGTIEQTAAQRGPGIRFHVAVGDNRARQRLAARALAAGWAPLALVDPSAIVASDAMIEPGAYVGIYSIVSSASRVGPFALVNHHVTVGHDVTLGACVQLCPGVRVSGACVLEEGALLGSNAVTLPGCRMGAWSTLGAGAVAARDVAAGTSQVRLPARQA